MERGKKKNLCRFVYFITTFYLVRAARSFFTVYTVHCVHFSSMMNLV